MNEKELLKIAKQSTEVIDIPKRPMIKNFRLWFDEVWWQTKITFLWYMVKLHLFSFNRWENMCFNRKLLFE